MECHTPLKLTLTLENPLCSIGNTSTNGCLSIFHVSFLAGVVRFVELCSGLRLASKEEMKSWDGILDERFQDNFRVRCRATWGSVEIGWLVGFLTGSWICELILDTVVT